MKAVIRMIVGVAFGIAAALALNPVLAAFSNGSAIAFAIVALSGVLGFLAPTIRRAFGRGFLVVGMCLIALPVLIFLLFGRAGQETIPNPALNDLTKFIGDTGVAGIVMTGVAASVCLISGLILIVAGTVLTLGGGRKDYR